MTKNITCYSPIDNSLLAQREIISDTALNNIIDSAAQSQLKWSTASLAEKAELCNKAIDYFITHTESIATEISQQMGRPIRYCAGEISGVVERARYMVDNAESALQDIVIENTKSKKRYIKRVPLGVAFIIAPWNYPYLTAINSIIPALMAGNTVILKHSTQTILCAERFYSAFEYAGLPEHVFQICFCDHQKTKRILTHTKINFVSFTGSVTSGAKIEQNLAGLFKHITLELGGNDPAYVHSDIETNTDRFTSTIANIVDGCFFNSGQSCCAIERIYVHQSIYDKFLEQFIALVKKYRINNPLLDDTTLGPVINIAAANNIRVQISQALSQGAKTCIADNYFKINSLPLNYLAPQILINVDHSMTVMNQESFAPIIGIMKVKNEQQAIRLMNDSLYGLSASVWSSDLKIGSKIAEQIHTGTVFVNRCDYLDPALAWVGIKNSGRGCSLSVLAYTQVTRPKSHFLHV